jgi:hypothetical protein
MFAINDLLHLLPDLLKGTKICVEIANVETGHPYGHFPSTWFSLLSQLFSSKLQ